MFNPLKPYNNMEMTKIKAVEKKDLVYFRNLAQTIMEQIKFPNIWVYGSWGAHNFIVGASDNGKNEPVLMFKVNGMKFKGYVHIFYDWMDYYRIEFVSTHNNLKKVINEVYCDELQEKIDNFVEKVKEYAY